jgi:hypothetical protein
MPYAVNSREELGLEVRVDGLLCVDWVSLHGPWDDLINLGAAARAR